MEAWWTMKKFIFIFCLFIFLFSIAFSSVSAVNYGNYTTTDPSGNTYVYFFSSGKFDPGLYGLVAGDPIGVFLIGSGGGSGKGESSAGRNPGGGGAGGAVWMQCSMWNSSVNDCYHLTSAEIGSDVTVTIGNAGTGSISTSATGTSGGNTVFGSLTAKGGGGGGSSGISYRDGLTGGCGGGGGMFDTPAYGAKGLSNQFSVGGNSSIYGLGSHGEDPGTVGRLIAKSASGGGINNCNGIYVWGRIYGKGGCEGFSTGRTNSGDGGAVRGNTDSSNGLAGGKGAVVVKIINTESSSGTPGEDGADGNSAYVYIAYASDDSGTDFTNTFNSSLDYIAIKSTDEDLGTPEASDFTGLWKNYKGETGPQGPQGLNGSKGDQGEQGIQGIQGPEGNVGATGPQGPQGLAGLDGNSAYVYIAYATDDSGSDFTTMFNANYDYIGILSTTIQIVPDAGDYEDLWKNYKGIQGIQGPEGNVGATGPQGPQGLNGSKGDQGEQGIQGIQGPEGNVGATGPQGPQGPQGIQGIPGEDGICEGNCTVPEGILMDTDLTSFGLILLALIITIVGLLFKNLIFNLASGLLLLFIGLTNESIFILISLVGAAIWQFFSAFFVIGREE